MNRFVLRAVLASVCSAALAGQIYAADAPNKLMNAAGSKTTATGGEAAARKAVESITTADAVESIRPSGFGNFYEVVLSNGDIIYADPTGSFVFSGSLIDVKGKKNVTQQRLNDLARIDFADLPLNQAIKQVKGNGKRVVATFEDPNCGYCKKLAKDLQELKDVTIYTFMVPILSPDSGDKSKNIWCASDRVKAWNDWMTEGKTPVAANCDSPIAKNSELGQKLRIRGTPTIFLADGSRIGGYVPVAELDKAISDATKPAKK